MAKRKIDNYVFSPGMSYKDNLVPNAYSLIDSNTNYIIAEAISWIQQEIDADNAPFIGYTYNQSKCERDIGFILSSYKNDLRYGGNEKTRLYAQKYWEGSVSQLDGDRQPEVVTHTYIKNLINNYILTNTAFTSLSDETQVIDTTKTAEASASTTITTLSTFLVDVIENGLGQLPTLDPNTFGYVKMQGKYNLSDILLITNNTTNDVIFNFTNNDTGAVIEVKDAQTVDNSQDVDFPKYLQTTDGVTTLKLNASTASQSADDDLQIFVEYTENGKSLTVTRPYDFGTDAIERMRVAPALSMLDADFEYGLQPTKWSAIGMMRGYPSIYEVPGSELNVSSVTTDASAGTGGVGQSLVTVNTVSPHGFTPGKPITIKALENSVAGASRAEGSFVIVETPSTRSFRYYAKAKVGTTSGEVLSTTYTQLRAAGFYTGSNISSNPVFTVESNGFSGTMVAELTVPTGETRIPYDGNTPELGAPLVHAGGNIPTGSQVTQSITQSSGGGTYLTAGIAQDISNGSNTFTVTDATGIITDLAIDRGDGVAAFITNIIGEDITISDNFTRDISGTTVTYSGVSAAPETGVGFNAKFDVSWTGGTYTVAVGAGINDAGEAYEVGDKIRILGSDVGGFSPDNDIIITVDGIFSLGSINALTATGTAFDGTGNLPGEQPPVEGGLGFGSIFDVTYTDNTYGSVTIDTSGESYTANDVIVIDGNNFLGGSSGTNDATVKVTTVDGSGGITAATVTGTAPNASVNYGVDNVDITYVYSGTTGSGAEFTVTRNGTVYSASIDVAGSNYLPTETFTIDGANLGGVTTTNDCIITVDNVGGSGEISAVSVSGTAANTDTKLAVSGTNLSGTGAIFTIDIAAGVYSVTIDDGGFDYATNQTFVIEGTSLGGTTPTNDATITVSTVDASGTITGATIAGTAITDTGSVTSVGGTNELPEGDGATFDVVRSASAYSVTVIDQGTLYTNGNRMIITGDLLGGQSPLHDLEIVVASVDTGGEILTVTENYEAAVTGESANFIATVTMSEATTGDILPLEEITFSALATLNVTFPNNHGLVPGDTFITTVTSDDGANNHNLAAGSFIATDIPTDDSLTFQARAAGNIDAATIKLDGVVYPRPDAFFTHRPYDGGVQLGTGGPQHGSQAIRQSKNYIRYQSGKGIMYTTGALFAPSYDLRSVTSDGVEVGSTITIVTDDNDHGVQAGGVIRLIGVETEGYNSGTESYHEPKFDYTVTRVVDERTFEVEAQRRLGATSAVLGFAAQMSVVSWHGATVRSGIFDDQNGIFWEYDGTQLSVVQRTGTKQVAGTIAMTVDDSQVRGTNTRFRDQLKAGDRIIIKGMTHVISNIVDQDTMYVTPDFRGVVDISGAKAMLITDKKVKQSEFNLDSLDGTGPSNYNFDHAKMQMIGIQYSWYGAGFIDFMVRGSDGNFVFAHRMRNSNVNTEAFMRSGNLPVRYEVSNEGPPGKLVADIDATQTSLVLEDSSFFPTTGTLYIDNEVIRFTGNNKTTNTLTGLTRGSTLTNFQAGATRAYAAGNAASHSNKTGVILISQTITPLISHWGSAFITDGGFDEDRGYIFSYTESSVPVTTTKQTAFLIRLAPSVSNAIIGDLGERELLNRAQLLLQGIECTSDTGTGGIVIEGVLNPKNYPTNPANIGWQTLSTEAQGGQPSFAQVAAGGSVTWSTGAAATTASATAIATLSVTMPTNENNGKNDEIDFDAIDYETSGPVVRGAIVSSTNSSGDTVYDAADGVTVQSIQYRQNDNDYRITVSADPDDRYDDDFTFTFGGNLSNRNFVYLTKTTFDSTNATIGTGVTQTGGSVNFPAGTLISQIIPLNHGGTEFYEVRFNNSFSGTFAAGSGTIEFEFVEPPYAQPGETVFSFIANPGERSVLSLNQLKELTNTTLGGRGTFPNGPDVLAINVYKVTGTSIDANIILRWGEAQA
jgi:hypothetical protein